jgi:hypothetical protein
MRGTGVAEAWCELLVVVGSWQESAEMIGRRGEGYIEGEDAKQCNNDEHNAIFWYSLRRQIQIVAQHWNQIFIVPRDRPISVQIGSGILRWCPS